MRRSKINTLLIKTPEGIVFSLLLAGPVTRFLAWENRLYIQNGISHNDPTINFFVQLQQGCKTQFRLHSQFVFTF